MGSNSLLLINAFVLFEQYFLKTARYLRSDLNFFNAHRYHRSSLYIKLQKTSYHHLISANQVRIFPLPTYD